MRPSALIFSPSLEGHRQVYLQYFIEPLIMKGYLVHIVSEISVCKNDYPYLRAYKSNPYVKFIEFQDTLQISLGDFRALQEEFAASLTIFLEAEWQLTMLSSQIWPGSPRLRGKNIGLFIRSTNYIHFPKKTPSIWNTLRFIKHFPKTWHSNPSIFHEFILPKFKLIDLALTVDEYFVESHSKTHQWFPDIIFPLLPVDPTIAVAERKRWEPELKSFLERNIGKEILLYFGEAQQRRGYDTLLKLACEEQCCFIHCGLFANNEKYNENVNELKENIASHKLLFETNEYIQSYNVIKLFFEACNYVILPYRNHFSSSGVMLQAIHFGKPVLVPDVGLMAARTKKYHLGFTFKQDDYIDLKEKWNLIKKDSYSLLDRLVAFKRMYSQENIQKVLDSILNQVVD